MNSVEAALRRIAADLDRRHLGWALIGGFAVSARSEPRFTRDVDIAVAVDDDRVAEQVVHGLVSGGYQLLASVEQDAVDRLATVRLSSVTAGDVVVDLLFASSGIEPEIVQSAEEIEVLPALAVPVARTGHLIAVKLLARDDETRPQDLADLRSASVGAALYWTWLLVMTRLDRIIAPDTIPIHSGRTALLLISRRHPDRSGRCRSAPRGPVPTRSPPVPTERCGSRSTGPRPRTTQYDGRGHDLPAADTSGWTGRHHRDPRGGLVRRTGLSPLRSFALRSLLRSPRSEPRSPLPES